MKRNIVFLMALFLVSLLAYAAYAEPSGANVTEVSESTWGGDSPEANVAQGGNITGLAVSGKSKSQVWQGYFGNVSGNVTLADSAGDQLYSWALTNVTGEIYASRSNAVTWASISGEEDCTVDETLTKLGPDKVSNTFTNASLTTPWQIGDVNVSAACSTHTYNATGPQTHIWQEIILDDGVNSVYATQLLNNSLTAGEGFNGGTHNFQMIVPEQKGAPTTTYYFYIEFS